MTAENLCESSAASPFSAPRRFAIVSEASAPHQLPLGLSAPQRSKAGCPPAAAAPPSRSRAAPRPRSPKLRPTQEARTGPCSTAEGVIAAVRSAIEAGDEELVTTAAPPERWLTPTQAKLRYGLVCLVRTEEGRRALVRISSYRAPRQKEGKRPYRRWYGLDLLAFFQQRLRREVRIFQVLGGGCC